MVLSQPYIPLSLREGTVLLLCIPASQKAIGLDCPWRWGPAFNFGWSLEWGPSEDVRNCRGLGSPTKKARELPREQRDEAISAAPTP